MRAPLSSTEMALAPGADGEDGAVDRCLGGSIAVEERAALSDGGQGLIDEIKGGVVEERRMLIGVVLG